MPFFILSILWFNKYYGNYLFCMFVYLVNHCIVFLIFKGRSFLFDFKFLILFVLRLMVKSLAVPLRRTFWYLYPVTDSRGWGEPSSPIDKNCTYQILAPPLRQNNECRFTLSMSRTQGILFLVVSTHYKVFLWESNDKC